MSDQTQDSAGEAIAGTSEPSMEDILASIRRIIAEDEGAEIAPDQDASPDADAASGAAGVSEDDSTLLVLDDPIDVTDETFDPLDLEIPEIENAAEAEPAIDISSDDDILEMISGHEQSEKSDAEPAAGSEVVTADPVLGNDDNIIDLVLEDIDLTDRELADAGQAAESKDPVATDTLMDEIEDILIIGGEDTEADTSVEAIAKELPVETESRSETTETDLVDEFLDNMIAEAPEPTEPAATGDVTEPALELAATSQADVTDIEIVSEEDIGSSPDLTGDVTGLEPEMATMPEPNEFDAVFEAAEPEAEPVIAANEDDFLADKDLPAQKVASSDADIDLVKSLMADLTDTSFMDGEGAGSEFDADKEELARYIEKTETASAEQDAVLDDILNLAMDDEIGHSQLLDDPNAAADDFRLDNDRDDPGAEALFTNRESDTNALLEIANAAEADAEWAQLKIQSPEPEDKLPEIFATGEHTDDGSILPEATDHETEILDLIHEADPADEDDVKTDPVIDLEALGPTETSGQDENLNSEEQETPEMPKPAVNPETILDEVTETAAADAFASLNQAVEEKTQAREAGPAIGQLVQDALRPMLKDWLDENLRDIVERAVQKEVKRISSGK